MIKKYYHKKLIRDRIPEKIKESEGEYETRVLGEVEFERELKKKLVEESNELAKAPKEELINELADVSIIVGSIAEYVNMGELLYDAILIVRDSNDTKICNLEEVQQTIKKRNLSNSSSIRTKNLGNDKYLIIDEEAGKSIKPVGYKPPNFKHLFK